MLSIVLKELRSRENMTQSALASAIGVSLGAVGNWESNKRMPDYDTLNKIADYFNVSVDYLLGRETKKDPSAGEGEKVSSELIALLQDLDPAEEALVRDYVAILKRSRKDQ